jgi:Fur family transcriptional regulator, ferric uptake regulator
MAKGSEIRPSRAGSRAQLRVRIILSTLGTVAELELPPEIRRTPQRRAVLDAVSEQEGAFTVVEVYDRARRDEPTLGLATVYRTVELLRSTGSIRPLAGAGEGAYVRCHRGHHHHLVCLSCGAVEETELCGAPSASTLARKHGFRAESHELDVYGTCRRCA